MKRVPVAGMSPFVIVNIIVFLLAVAPVLARDALNPAGDPRYGRHALAPGFAPTPATFNALSGGDIEVKTLNLGDNCLGYAASDPDFLINLTGAFRRITFLVASEEDTTLVINLPNGSWACNDDTNGLNPALVFHNAPTGGYRVWIGSYTAETYDESVLTITEAGPESLPTTATGPDPSRDPLYGDESLRPGFQPSPFTVQIIGGGHNQIADAIAGEQCRGFVSEAPDFSIILSDLFAEIWFALHSPADMTLLANDADGAWHCSDDFIGANPAIGFSFPPAGRYDFWVGSADEDNFAAAILYATEQEPGASTDLAIDASCAGMLGTALQVGARAVVTEPAHAGITAYKSPDTATTPVFKAPPSSSLNIVGGPVCTAEHRWWRADFGGGITGWIADGDSSTRWLEPQ